MEHRLFDPGNPPEWLDPEWWRDRAHCNHLEAPSNAHTARLQAAAALASEAANDASGYVVDLGAGDGALLSLLEYGLKDVSYGYEIIRADAEYARRVRGVTVYERNVSATLDETPLGPVVVLTEVLEHLADPHGFLAKLAQRDSVKFVVASSPWNETPVRHEWNHAWAWDTEGYARLFEGAGFEARQYHRVEWSQVCLFEVVRDDEVEADAAEMTQAIVEAARSEHHGLTTDEAVAVPEDAQEDAGVDAMAYALISAGHRPGGPWPLVEIDAQRAIRNHLAKGFKILAADL